MSKALMTGLMIIFITGCTKSDHFWYPVALKEVTCSGFKGEVYLMTNSVGWRSWPYYLNPTDKREIELGTDCVMKIIKRLPKHKRVSRSILTDEQKKYLINGF